MLRVLAVVTAGLLIALPGLVQGVWSGRWSRSPDLERAVARLGSVPMRVGDWDGQDLELDRKQVVEGAGLDGYLFRRYANRRDGREVEVILACGRPGPASVHSPDVCLPSAGYEVVAAPVRCRRDGAARPAELWTARFQKEEGVPLCRRVFWAWSGDGTWQAPDRPRLAFAHFGALYKLYVVQEAGKADEQAPEEDCDDFLHELLHELDQVLFAAP
jgi:hypothetical protein